MILFTFNAVDFCTQDMNECKYWPNYQQSGLVIRVLRHKYPLLTGRRDFRFGSLADIGRRQNHVRLAPDSCDEHLAPFDCL